MRPQTPRVAPNEARDAPPHPAQGLPAACVSDRQGRPRLRARSHRYARARALERSPQPGCHRHVASRCGSTASTCELEEIKLDRKPLTKKDYKLTDTTLTLVKTPQAPFTLEIATSINPDANKALQGLYRSNGVYCTQCEAEGFRRITYFLDRPDVLATYTVRIEADLNEAPVLLSNGNLLERGTLDGGRRHYAVWHDPFPKPCYLFALVGGDLSSIASTFRTMSGREVDLRIYVEHGKEERAAWAMDSLKRAMRWDEERFGREYDLDVFNIVAVSDFNMGAMENKGLNVFNDRLILASPETATDTIFEQSRAWSRTSTSTTGRETASPAATGSSSASRKG